MDLIDLYRHAAETAYLIDGDVDEALALVESGIRAADEPGDRRRGGPAACSGTGPVHGHEKQARSRRQAGQRWNDDERAVARIRHRRASAGLAGRARFLQMNARDREAMPLAEQALAIARLVGARCGESRAGDLRGQSLQTG